MSKKILICEDDRSFQWILKQSFSNEDFVVLTAENGEQGLATALQEKPDLILLDIMMPKMDGLTMAKSLKEKGFETKIIFLTNLKDDEHISQAMETTKDTEYIIKSDLHVDQVVSRVKEKLGM